jgi:DNA-binding MarR family transcriptional regulator
MERDIRDLTLLEEIERDPDLNQADLATQLGVAVGTVNWHLKRLVAKGYIKVKRAERKKLRYIITPEGIALRARLTMQFVEQSMSLYRDIRSQSRQALEQAREKGIHKVYIDGDGDIADICRLSCLEAGFQIADRPASEDVAVLEIEGKDLVLQMPDEQWQG